MSKNSSPRLPVISQEEIELGQLHDDIRNCADRLHQLSIVDAKNATIAHNIINKVKE